MAGLETAYLDRRRPARHGARRAASSLDQRQAVHGAPSQAGTEKRGQGDEAEGGPGQVPAAGEKASGEPAGGGHRGDDVRTRAPLPIGAGEVDEQGGKSPPGQCRTVPREPQRPARAVRVAEDPRHGPAVNERTEDESLTQERVGQGGQAE